MSTVARTRPPIGAEPGQRGGAWRRLRARFRPPRSLKITPLGRTYLVVTLGVGLGALNTGNNLLYLVLGLLLSLIVISGVLSERCLRGLEVRRLGADAAFAGEPFAFRWALTRKGGRAFALEVTELNPGLEGGGALALLEPGATTVVRGDLIARQRGPHRLRGVRVTTHFPLGIFAKSRDYDLEDTLLVYPRRVPVPRHGTPAADPQDGSSANPRTAGGTGEVVALAPLAEGDDARRIHWLKSASLGQLVRLEREREERRTYHLRVPLQAAAERLERECEQLAATAHELLGRGHEVGLDAGELRLRPSAGPAQERRILQALATAGFAVEAEAETPRTASAAAAKEGA